VTDENAGSKGAAIGFHTMAESFRDAAITLRDAPDQSARVSAPLDYLAAHALELSLKAQLRMRLFSEETLNKVFGHDLLKLYDELELHDPELMKSVTKRVRSNWKTLLRGQRDDIAEPFKRMGIDDERWLREMGVPDNSDIGQGIEDPRKALQWFSERHAKHGSLFRYPLQRMDHRKRYRIGQFEADIPLTTAIWIVDALVSNLRERA
jgi:hypothetical protein